MRDWICLYQYSFMSKVAVNEAWYLLFMVRNYAWAGILVEVFEVEEPSFEIICKNFLLTDKEIISRPGTSTSKALISIPTQVLA